ncbi:hypothetical protein L9F63_000812 [Diploptera punctata]|uniref:Hexosyltransferase n=1 Tax=Diploptera punctata TaxID=6984 RepID=A0AAD8ETG8_DIPPU|nr:hypothetical protein L9F63_000812 [Diploptera punctata]
MVVITIIGLQFMWARRSEIDIEQYDWLIQNRNAREYVLPDKYTTLVQPEEPKCDSQLRLLIMVPSSPNNIEIRQAIRDTWGHRDSDANSRLLFFLGHNGNVKHQRILDTVLSEAQEHNDVIIEDFVDAYVNLTLKTIFMLKWIVNNCNSVPFILKTDDDMIINVHRLQQELPMRFDPSKSLILGRIQENAVPYRDKSSKWYLPQILYEPNYFPTFAAGTAYVITQKALPELYSGALDTPLIPLEDVFLTGLVANAKLGIPLISIEGFHNNKPSISQHPCLFYPHFTLHQLNPGQMRKIWLALRNLKPQDCNTYLTRFLIYMFGIGKPQVNKTYTW